MICRNLTGFLLFFACVFSYCVLVLGSRRERTRITRHNMSNKCNSKIFCRGNRATFDTADIFNCRCDNVCYELFSDCCPDYEKHCGRQKLVKNLDENAWRCVKLGIYSRLGKLSAANGVWMIANCPRNWSPGETKNKCENPEVMIDADTMPVVGDNNFTYRNMYCAVCHEVKNYSSWDVLVFTNIVPPKGLDLRSKLVFITQNGGHIGPLQPGKGQPRRYCAEKNYINNCVNTTHVDYIKCVNGPIEVVKDRKPSSKLYKNHACASCNGQPAVTAWSSRSTYVNSDFREYNLAFNVHEPRGKPSCSVISKFCPPDTVLDRNLQFCRRIDQSLPDSKLSNDDEFLIVLWFRRSSIKGTIGSALAKNLQSALNSNFSIPADQISAITFHNQDKMNAYIVATFRLILTPVQSSILTDQEKSHFDSTRENMTFLLLFNSTSKGFTLLWGNSTFPVVKVTAQHLAVHDDKQIESQDDCIIEMKMLVVNLTRGIFWSPDYIFLKNEVGGVALCRKLVLSACSQGVNVPLTPDEYVIFSNLTVYYKKRRSAFNFDDYLSREILNKQNVSDEIQRNSIVTVCLPLGNTFSIPKTETKYGIMTGYRLRIVTLSCLPVSIICHVLLLVTYGLFRELRTVPGLNLMNLSISLCLSQLIWFMGTAHFEGTVTCEILAILQHYLMQVSFLAMSVISYHTYHVFSQPFLGRIANKNISKFIKYSVLVWLTPAVFVAGFVILDKTQVVPVDYGMKCWLGTNNAKLYFFLLPLATKLFYSICKLIQTAISLYRHDESTHTLQQKAGKQNLIICIKLATLVNVPWLFAFLNILFPDVEAFGYLFVACVCKQGLLIAIVFLFNKRIWKLYKDRWNARRNINVLQRNVAVSPAEPVFYMA